VDKKSLIGLGLIAVILGVWIWLSGPTKEQIAKQKHIKDSIELANQKALEAELKNKTQIIKSNFDSIKAPVVENDSLKHVTENQNYLDFANALYGNDSISSIENEKVKVYISNKGGQIVKVELKEYSRSGEHTPLTLFEKDSTEFSLILSAYNKAKVFKTSEFYFKPIKLNEKSITMRLQTTQPNSYIDFNYSLNSNDYIVNSGFNLVGMQTILSSNVDDLQLNWKMLFPSQEKYIVKERQAATVYFKQIENKPDYINPMKDEVKELTDADIKWISFKQQFFNSTLIASTKFERGGSLIEASNRANTPGIVKAVRAELGVKYNHTPNEKFEYKFYFGPNHYNTLKTYNDELEGIIPTGWSIFSYINKWMVIPLFNGLSGLNMGIVILILTIIVKVILFPIGYKTYLSGARMRVLKPEIDALNAKFDKNADPMKKQQEQMALYRKAGVNPLSGCLPMLLQFPILIALFAFIPAAIELRQKGFLWADDLSTYDSIWTFGKVPFISWAYGDHVSLFAALMFVSTLIYTYMNSNLMPQQNNQMPGMKFMMYFMPVIFLAVMNEYAAGLSWYYFLANMMTFLQNYGLKFIVKDEKIRAEIDANMKKPQKKGGFAARLEEMAKQRQADMNKARGKK
jgi:YidC/Oxa1 family membrane protein insertase